MDSQTDNPQRPVDNQEQGREPRLKTLSTKGNDMYEQSVIKHTDNINRKWLNLDAYLQHVTSDGKCLDFNSLLALDRNVRESAETFRRVNTEFAEYLIRTNTEKSLQDLDSQRLKLQGYTLLIEQSLYELGVYMDKEKAKQPENARAKSTGSKAHSRKSGLSKQSSRSSVLAQKKAKAEAQKARLVFAEKEAELRKKQAELNLEIAHTEHQKANLHVELELLAEKKEVAAAEAEAEALESLSETSSNRSSSRQSLIKSIPAINSLTLTKAYVDGLASNETDSFIPTGLDEENQGTNIQPSLLSIPQYTPNFDVGSGPGIRLAPSQFQYTPTPIQGPYATAQLQGLHTSAPPLCPNMATLPQDTHRAATYREIPLDTYRRETPQDTYRRETQQDTHRAATSRDTHRVMPPYATQMSVSPHTNSPEAAAPQVGTQESTFTTDFTRFLLKKDLLLSRLANFNDKPETYQTWKLSFRSIMVDLDVTPRDEIDLLEKWSGPESRKQVTSLKASNYRFPERSLVRIWDRLDERYGAPEMVEASIKQRIVTFPKLTTKDTKKLFELSDLVSEIESLKEDGQYQSLLGHFDSSTGVSPIVSKLPYNLQEKWTGAAVRYTKSHSVTYPPFSYFAEFLRDLSKVKNNPSFVYEQAPTATPGSKREKPFSKNFHDRNAVSVRKTSMETVQKSDNHNSCLLHRVDTHTLIQCKAFLSMSIEDRRKFLREKRICFRCCESTSHISRDCKVKTPCGECGSDKHCSALHSKDVFPRKSYVGLSQDGGEPGSEVTSISSVNVNCTQICGSEFSGKSCAKIVLVNVFHEDQPGESVRLYAMIDDQSNMSLAKSELFDQLQIQGHSNDYTLSSLSGVSKTSGRDTTGIVVESIDQSVHLSIPILLECDQVPEIRNEIPTSDVAEHYAHLQDIAGHIPPVDHSSRILLLLGRDVISAHHVLDQRIGPANTPYAQKLPLGWVIIGETCLGKTHMPKHVNSCKTNILADGRPSLFKPCPNEFEVRKGPICPEYCSVDTKAHDRLGDYVFQRTKDDEKVGMSQEDRSFLRIMDDGLVKGDSGNWIAPLPFREPRPRLANNRSQALKRAKTLNASLRKDPLKQQHFVTFMDKIFSNGHAELAPELKDNEECWYLPIFGVYHPRKPDQLRAVFDSSARHNGTSLNDVLMSGPDLVNSLLGVLMRFRREPIAIAGDVQQMFYCFRVREDHRNYLRFLWYKDNNLDNELVEYRMCVHVFGNSPSPAIATMGLRKSVEGNDADVLEFVSKDFYVDDGLTSLPSVDEAVNLMRRTQVALQQGGNLRLHKIASNSEEVMSSFPSDDLSKDIKDLDLGSEPLPIQCSLGVNWCLETDSFLFQVSADQKPYTRRGVLSTVNGIFDPLGFVAPVVIQGKLFLRSLLHGTKDWDEPLPPEHRQEWEHWRNSLNDLRHIEIPRTYAQCSHSRAADTVVHIFSDASEKAIAAVGYLQTTEESGIQHLGFILGKAKVAPSHGHTIPRLELCAAVLAVDIGEIISDNLHIPLDKFQFNTDSKVVLGYIYNKTRRFYTYVANRVERIVHLTKPEQWSFVSTDRNPADGGTRSLSAQSMRDSMWLSGPTHLHPDAKEEGNFDLCEPEDDKEVRPKVHSLKTDVTRSRLGSYFSHLSHWRNLVEAIRTLKYFARILSRKSECHAQHTSPELKSVDAYREAEQFVIREVQQEIYPEELDCLKHERALPKGSPILSLNPFVDAAGIIRVGGRLQHSGIHRNEKNPIIIPGRHHIATLLVRFYHEEVKHQGRHFTEGAVRTAGYWITGCKRLVSSLLHLCVTCRKLRGKLECQKMADLPPDRLEPGPPFTNVGVDTFGPWQVVSRRTRGGLAQAKRWALLFTCLTTRGIHIEVVEELSSSSFINAFRRFTAIRGSVKQIRSDRGTNFVGAVDDLQIDAVRAEDGEVQDFLYDRGTTWLFNPPHASHMGGVWERMIGVTRRVLESMLTEVADKNLTHEVLVTFLAEVSAIVNARPLVPVSSDPEDPFILSPSILLTQKTDSVVEPFVPFDNSSLYKVQWKRVQLLAEIFWKRWRTQYLNTLQTRRKWNEDRRNVAQGDIVLLRNKEVGRNNWPMGYVLKTFPSVDGRVRKAEIRVVPKEGNPAIYVRPVNETIVLLENSK